MTAAGMLEVQALQRLAGIDGHESKFFDVLGEMAKGGQGGGFSVGRNSEVGGQIVGNLGGLAPVQRDLHHLVAIAASLIDHPSGRSTNGKLIYFAVGKLFEITAVGIHAPDIQDAAPLVEEAGENDEAAIGTSGSCFRQ